MTRPRPGVMAFAGVGVISLVLLFSPASQVPGGVGVNDKVVHCLLFTALAVTGRLAGVPAMRLLLGLVTYAVISELLQSWLPLQRDGDLADVFADIAGVLAGAAGVALIDRVVRCPTRVGSVSHEGGPGLG